MNNIEMKTEYEGYVITWEDFYTSFCISKDGVRVKEYVKTLEGCQRWINQKNKQKFKRVPILYNFSYRGGMIPGEATSIVDGRYVWVSSGKDRNKAAMDDVWLDTPKNRKALDCIKTKRDQIETLQDEIEEIESTTERLTAEMMIDEQEGL